MIYLFIYFLLALKVSVQCLAFSTVKSFTRQLELQFPPFKCQMWFAGEFKPKRGCGGGWGALIKCRMRLEKKKKSNFEAKKKKKRASESERSTRMMQKQKLSSLKRHRRSESRAELQLQVRLLVICKS